MKPKKYPMNHYEIEGVKNTEEHIEVLEIIKKYVKHGFRHRYIEEYGHFFLATKEKIEPELAKKLKEKGLVLRVLKG